MQNKCVQNKNEDPKNRIVILPNKTVVQPNVPEPSESEKVQDKRKLGAADVVCLWQLGLTAPRQAALISLIHREGSAISRDVLRAKYGYPKGNGLGRLIKRAHESGLIVDAGKGDLWTIQLTDKANKVMQTQSHSVTSK